ncbi:hypothetical protein HYC85_000808 [Camellia sinensis]|uniref:Uncharacterized protein n=1 Tax=Camellia sinensis TaxID=4442 RepID=A0A7J7I3U1_CAMSI|nr:hypothetical protein HYC85_000808 [Camellia sinensis]
MTWLDMQPPKSVIYVTIGSLAMMTSDQGMELARFEWEGQILNEVLEATAERGWLEEVLAHPAVGRFLTHNGCNSSLKGMVEGLPMVYRPHFVDQQVNSRFVSE